MPATESPWCCRGATLKTRKRNITVPLDPGSFADAVVTIFDDAKEPDATVTQKLQVHPMSLCCRVSAVYSSPSSLLQNFNPGIVVGCKVDAVMHLHTMLTLHRAGVPSGGRARPREREVGFQPLW